MFLCVCLGVGGWVRVLQVSCGMSVRYSSAGAMSLVCEQANTVRESNHAKTPQRLNPKPSGLLSW